MGVYMHVYTLFILIIMLVDDDALIYTLLTHHS